MAGFLKNLKVNKVSFVGKPANKRKFILLKAADSSAQDSISTSGDDNANSNNNNNQNQGEPVKMRAEIKTALKNAMKTEKSPDKLVGILKSDAALKITEAEIAEVKDFLDLMPAPVVNTSPVVTPSAAAAVSNSATDINNSANLVEENKKLVARLEKMENLQRHSATVQWLQKECPFMTDNVEDMASEIVRLEDVSKSAADKFKEQLKKTNSIVANSRLFEENGVNSTEELLEKEGDGFALVRKVANQITELRKSDKPLTPQSIINVIKGHSREYNEYRLAHIRRAKQEAI